MALLDQLFRIRGAPRSGGPPVTLGAMAAALDALPATANAARVPAPATPLEAAPAANSPNVPNHPTASRGAEESLDSISARAAASQVPARDDAKPIFAQPRNGTRFNPFAVAAEGAPGPHPNERTSESSRAAGPCIEDPSLPPLRLQAQVPSDTVSSPRVLGAPETPPDLRDAPEPLRQIEPPAVRLAPVKAPAAGVELSQVKKPSVLRLEIQADPSLDVVAFKQHAAKFPGVLKCVISHAGD